MRRGDHLPPVWVATGAVDDPRGLLRFGDLGPVLVPVGPVVGGPGGGRGAQVHGTGPGGVEHDEAPGIGLVEAVDRLRWCATRDLRAVVAVRGTTPGEPATLAGRLCRGLEGDAVAAESLRVSLNGADVTGELTTGSNGGYGRLPGVLDGWNVLRVRVQGRRWWRPGGLVEEVREVRFLVRGPQDLDRG